MYARFEYEPWGVVKTMWDDHGNREEFDYDPLSGYQSGHRTVLADPVAGAPRTLERVFETGPAGRVTKVTMLGAGTASIAETFEYDSLDQIVCSTDAEGHITERSYRYDGRPLSVTRRQAAQPLKSVHAYSYTPGGLMHSATDNRQQTVRWTYDGLQRVRREIEPDQEYWEWSYNQGGFVTSVRTPTGRTATMQYSDAGRLDSELVQTEAGKFLGQRVFTWTPLGHLKGVTKNEIDLQTSIVFTRDSEGLALTETQDGHVVRLDRDSLGRLEMLDAPSSMRSYGYDDRNRND